MEIEERGCYRLKTLENQTVYQCEYCNKRFLTKQGAKKHEEQYCYKSPIPKQKRLEEIMKCNHHWEMDYRRMPGESHLLEPDGEYCIHCGVRKLEWERMKKEGAACV